MTDRIQKLEEKVDLLTEQVSTLLNLWQRGLGVITFIKWSAVVSSSIAAVFIFFKDHWK